MYTFGECAAIAPVYEMNASCTRGLHRVICLRTAHVYLRVARELRQRCVAFMQCACLPPLVIVRYLQKQLYNQEERTELHARFARAQNKFI